jgi:hypothetical protein
MMSSRTLFTLVMAVVFAGCTWQPRTARELQEWVNDPDHGLVTEQRFGDLSLRLSYQPEQLLRLRDQENGDTLEVSSSDRYGGSHQFVMRIQADGVSNLLDAPSPAGHDHNAKLYYYTTLVQDDLLLVVGQDTIPCAQAHFERNYGSAPFNNLVFSFVDEHQEPFRDDLELIYYDRAFGAGPITFTIRRDDLLDIPQPKRS